MRVVLDTNVVISRYLSLNGLPAEVLRRWDMGDFDVVLSTGLLEEYARVFEYPRLFALHRLTSKQIVTIVETFRAMGIDVGNPPVEPLIIDDPDDDIVIACARAGRASFIITGDKHLLALGRVDGIEILTPNLFLHMLDGEMPL